MNRAVIGEQGMTTWDTGDRQLCMCLEQWTVKEHSEHKEHNTVCMLAPVKRYLCDTNEYKGYVCGEQGDTSEQPACVGTLGTTTMYVLQAADSRCVYGALGHVCL